MFEPQTERLTESDKPVVALLFRSPHPTFFSIEVVFKTLASALKNEFQVTCDFSPYPSRGFFNRLMTGLWARRRSADIFHITGDISFISLFLPSQKTVLTIHDCGHVSTLKGLRQIIYKIFWIILPVRKVAVVTTISQKSKEEILKIAKIDPQKVIVIPNPCTISASRQLRPVVSSLPRILQIGTKTNKNLFRLFSALSGIDCKLVIVGELQVEHKSMLNKERISFENFVDLSYEDLIQQYIMCDIVSFVSTYEGFGLPILEAQASRRLLVCSDLEPMRTISGRAAVLVDPLDVSDIRRGFLDCLRMGAEREKILDLGVQNVKNYNPYRVARRYSRVYLDLLNGKIDFDDHKSSDVLICKRPSEDNKGNVR